MFADKGEGRARLALTVDNDKGEVRLTGEAIIAL